MADLITYLCSSCCGKANAKTSNELERRFNCRGKDIRAIVHELRCAGIPICSSIKGYYYGIDECEIRKTIEGLTNRISNMQEAVDGLKSILLRMESVSGC